MQTPKPNTALQIALVLSGLTQRKVARRARVDESRLSGIARGRLLPTATEQRRIARVLNMPVEELFSPSTNHTASSSDEAVAS
jgi:transcriptional regulator with XRE-family HTH domain